MTTYNQEELKKAEEAFPNLAEYKRAHLEARLAIYDEEFVLVITGADKDRDIPVITETGYNLLVNKGAITYLEPPRESQPMFTEEEKVRLIRDLRYLTADPKKGNRDVHNLRGVILNKLGWELATPQQTEHDTPPTKEQLLSKVPRLLTEDERKSIQYALQHCKDTNFMDYRLANTLNEILHGLTNQPPEPKKVPWGQLEHLRFALENGGVENCQINGVHIKQWPNIDEFSYCGIWYNDGGHFVNFTDITHVRGPDGVEVKCETEPPTEKEGQSE